MFTILMFSLHLQLFYTSLDFSLLVFYSISFIFIISYQRCFVTSIIVVHYLFLGLIFILLLFIIVIFRTIICFSFITQFPIVSIVCFSIAYIKSISI